MPRGLTGPSGVTLGSIHANTMALASALLARRNREPDRCRGAGDDELVVPLRLGDMTSDIASAKERIDAYMESDCGTGITKAVVTGVLHYGYTVGSNPTGRTSNTSSLRFSRTDYDDTLSLTTMRRVINHLASTHTLQVRVRSEPNADLDMCLSVFSRHIVDGILIAGSFKQWTDTNTKRVKKSNGRVPGQAQLRKDVLAMLTSHEMNAVLDAAAAAAAAAANKPPVVSQIQLPCFPYTSRKPNKMLWSSVTIQYGPLTALQFASLCASVSMVHGLAKTMCIRPTAPDRCEHLVKNGISTKRHLVCMTLSEMDAVESARRPQITLLVTIDKRHRGMERLGFPHGYTSTHWRTTASALEKKWHASHGPGWPKDKHISYLISTDALRDHDVHGSSNQLVAKYGKVLGLTFKDEMEVRIYIKLIRTLMNCCGSQMDPTYRRQLWARGGGGGSITGGTANGGFGDGDGARFGAGGVDGGADGARTDWVNNVYGDRGLNSGDGGANEPASKTGGYACHGLDLNQIEQQVLATRVFQRYNQTDVISKLSDFDERLNGSYCLRAEAATARYKLGHNDVRYRNLDLGGATGGALESAVTAKASRLEAEREALVTPRYNSTAFYFQFGKPKTGTTLQFITLCAASCLLHGPATQCMNVRGDIETEESYRCRRWNSSHPPLVCKSLKMSVPRPATKTERALENAQDAAVERPSRIYRERLTFHSREKKFLFATASSGPVLQSTDGWQRMRSKQQLNAGTAHTDSPLSTFTALADLVGNADDPFLLKGYASALHLSSEEVTALEAFLTPWNKLRGCCGAQNGATSKKVLSRAPRHQKQGGDKATKNSKCAGDVLDALETKLSNSKVFRTCGGNNLKLTNPCH